MTIQERIAREFIGVQFNTTEIEKELSFLYGKEVYCLDTKISDSVEDEYSMDSYLMQSLFNIIGSKETIRIYYGNNTNEITHIEIS